MSAATLVKHQTSSDMVYFYAIPVKRLFSVNSDEVKNYVDLFNSFTESIAYIKKLKENGWEYDWRQSDEWLHFFHTDRNVAIEELGLDDVQDQEKDFNSYDEK